MPSTSAPRCRAAIASQHGGHADQPRTAGAQHPDLRRRLVLRPAKARVDGLGQVRRCFPRGVAQPGRVRRRQVGEAHGPAGGGAPVSGDAPVRLSWSLISTGWPGVGRRRCPGRVRQDHGAASGRHGSAHAVHDGRRGVALVQVHAAEEGEHLLAAARMERTAGAWPGTVGAGRPPRSAKASSASAGPIAPAAAAQPEPSTTATSCRGLPVSAASRSALAPAAAYGSACGECDVMRTCLCAAVTLIRRVTIVTRARCHAAGSRLVRDDYASARRRAAVSWPAPGGQERGDGSDQAGPGRRRARSSAFSG